MSDSPRAEGKESSPQETDELLKRILAAVEQEKRGRWAEVACAIVLAVATMASAWCAYQSTLWGGVQTFRLAAVAKAGRGASQARLAALQGRAFDAQMLIAYLETKGRGDEKLAGFLLDRFRPEAKTAVDAWLKTDPFNNPRAARAPFQLTEYVQPELQEAERLEEQLTEFQTAAESSNAHSDTYVLLTVLFASVLFFGGIGASLDSRTLRYAVFGIAMTLLVGTLIVLITMPICRE